jgi:hypothetical protein
MHIRRAILEALRTQLKTLPGITTVRIKRTGPAGITYPNITLAAESESTELITIHGQPRPQDRILNVNVIAWVRGTVDDEKAEADMDNAAVMIESILTRPTVADDLQLISTDFMVAEDEPEIHAITLTYRITYTSTESSATV